MPLASLQHSNTPLLQHSITPLRRQAFRTRSPCSSVRIVRSGSGPRLRHPYRHSRNDHSGRCGLRWGLARSADGAVRSRCPDRPRRPAGLLRMSGSTPEWTWLAFSVPWPSGAWRRGPRRRRRDRMPPEDHLPPAQRRRGIGAGFCRSMAHRFEPRSLGLVQGVLVVRR